MTDKQLTILAIVAAVMLVIAALLYSGGGAPKGTFVSGTPLIQGLDPLTVHKIVVKSGSKTTTLERKDSGFVVSDREGYPASTKDINDLIIKCRDIRCDEKMTEASKNHADLGVVEDDKDATTVSFLDDKDKPIIGFIKGKNAESSSGVYVRLLGSDTVYRTEEGLWLDERPTDFIDKGLIKVKKDDVESVEVKVGKDTYTIQRGKDDKIELQAVPKGKRAKVSDVEDVFNALSNLDLADVARDGKKKLDWDATFTCRLKTHLTYTVELSKKDSTHYVRLSASFPPDIRITRPDKDTPKDELKKKEAILLAADTAQKFGPRHDGWVYEISSYDAEKMRKPFADVIEDDLPDEIAASHILIAYKGSERADDKVARSKEDARKLADKVLKEAKQKDADFAKLAEKYSDGPTKDKRGDLGAFKKGKMAKAFDDAAFKLKVGEISDVVETKFGFHVIKRTK